MKRGRALVLRIVPDEIFKGSRYCPRFGSLAQEYFYSAIAFQSVDFIIGDCPLGVLAIVLQHKEEEFVLQFQGAKDFQ